MKRSWLTGVLTGLTVGLAAFAVTGTIYAQGKPQGGPTPITGRVACVDVVKTFNEFQRQKDLSGEMKDVQDKLQEENRQRRQRIDVLQAEIDKLDPEDPTYVPRTRELLSMQIDYKNWVDVRQADMSREVAVWSLRIYKEIIKAVEELARRDGYDMVFYRGQFEPPAMDPDAIKEQIRSLQLLYANPAVDITQVVIDKLNNDYRAQPRAKMMYMP